MRMDRKGFLDWLYGLRSNGVKLGLGNITELLDSIGDPQRSFRSVHVAGTDGKGSVCSCIYSILRRSVGSVGLYTSPHLLEFNERIEVDGKEIGDDELADMAALVIPAVTRMEAEGRTCTFFEVTTAVAFMYFKQRKVDYAVVEVGMGGRFDATNVLVPEVCAISNISMDHMEFLGDTIEKIAFEKAGIIKHGVPCATVNGGPALDVVASVASERDAPLIRVAPDDVRVLENRGDGVVFTYKGRRYEVSIPGKHQAFNASLAVAAVSELGFCDEEDIESGLREARWPCRMEKLRDLPIILDVSHTDAGSRDLMSDVKEIYGRVLLVFGMLGDKSIGKVSENLSHIADRAIVARPDSERAAPAADVAAILSGYMDDITVVDTVQDAMDEAMRTRKDGEIILVTGSFHMAEGALKWLGRTSARY